MVTRPLVLGATGMIGHRVFLELRRRHPRTTGTSRGTSGAGIIGGIRATDCDVIRSLIEARRPEVVVNCIGAVKQSAEGQMPESAIIANALLPHRLAAWCAEYGARLIHMSTDCVFAGDRGNYSERDIPDADDLYGRSKALGEPRSHTGNVLTLRTSAIGTEIYTRYGLLEWFLAQSGRTRGYTQARFSGVSTLELARLVADIADKHGDLSGVYHVAGPAISKHDLLVMIKDVYDLPVSIVPSDIEQVDRTLDGSRLRGAIGYEAPSWEAMVAELRDS